MFWAVFAISEMELVFDSLRAATSSTPNQGARHQCRTLSRLTLSPREAADSEPRWPRRLPPISRFELIC